MPTKKILKIGFAVSMLWLAGCTSIVETNRFSHGYVPSEKDMKEAKQNGATQATIQESFGKPLVVGTYAPNYWYYIAYSTEQYGFSKRKFTKFTILELKFDNGRLAFSKRYNKDNLQEIAFSQDSTKNSARKLGFFEQMLSNIGKFRPQSTGQ